MVARWGIFASWLDSRLIRPAQWRSHHGWFLHLHSQGERLRKSTSNGSHSIYSSNRRASRDYKSSGLAERLRKPTILSHHYNGGRRTSDLLQFHFLVLGLYKPGYKHGHI